MWRIIFSIFFRFFRGKILMRSAAWVCKKTENSLTEDGDIGFNFQYFQFPFLSNIILTIAGIACYGSVAWAIPAVSCNCKTKRKNMATNDWVKPWSGVITRTFFCLQRECVGCGLRCCGVLVRRVGTCGAIVATCRASGGGEQRWRRPRLGHWLGGGGWTDRHIDGWWSVPCASFPIAITPPPASRPSAEARSGNATFIIIDIGSSFKYILVTSSAIANKTWPFDKFRGLQPLNDVLSS